ncbi:MAG: hypothetical protein MUC35_07580 [Candidatus Margulisbacteria bacterium]|jgi:hypothetical protein|nr:hypothetical protein [Candidatus Margulisiibacteriota bacterium]
MMKQRLLVGAVISLLMAVTLITAPVFAAVPMRINFQGKLNDEAMKAANFDKGSTVKCTFKIGSAYQGSCTLTTDEAKAKTDGITFVDSYGVFSVSIGGGGEVKDEVGTLGAVDWTQDNLMLNISFTPAIVTAGNQPLNSTPYAFTAQNVSGGSVYATRPNGIAVFGVSDKSYAVYGKTGDTSAGLFGVYGAGWGGVKGESKGGGPAIEGAVSSAGGWAGSFYGDVNISGKTWTGTLEAWNDLRASSLALTKGGVVIPTGGKLSIGDIWGSPRAAIHLTSAVGSSPSHGVTTESQILFENTGMYYKGAVGERYEVSYGSMGTKVVEAGLGGPGLTTAGGRPLNYRYFVWDKTYSDPALIIDFGYAGYKNGYVGIGTTETPARLTVGGTVDAMAVQLRNGANVTTIGHVLTCQDASGLATWQPASSGGTSSAGGWTVNTTTSKVTLSNSAYKVGVGGDPGNAKFYVNGNVGIGTSNPGMPLTVFGGAQINGANVQGLIVDTSGKVGVGTSPTAALTVLGDVDISKDLKIGGNSGTAGQVLTSSGPGVAPYWGAGGSGGSSQWSTVTDGIQYSGKVGIGAAPQSQIKLAVMDDTYPAISLGKPPSNNWSTWAIATNDGYYSSFAKTNDTVLRSTAGSLILTSYTAGGSVIFGNGDPDTEKMRLNLDGNLSIGTQFSKARLNVVGGIFNVGNPTWYDTQGTYLGWNGMTGGAGETDFVNNKGAGVGGFGFFDSANRIQPLMFIATDGKVGVGTSSPTVGLDVANGSIIARGSSAGITGRGLSLVFDSSIDTGYLRCKDDDTGYALPLSLIGNPVRMANEAAHRVGIGTNTPSAKLTVDPQGAGGILIGNPNTAAGGYTSLGLTISAASGGYAKIEAIKSAGSQWGNIVINPDGGNVGIGYTNPTSKLNVNGAAYFNGYVQSTSIVSGDTGLTAGPGAYVFKEKTAFNVAVGVGSVVVDLSDANPTAIYMMSATQSNGTNIVQLGSGALYYNLATKKVYSAVSGTISAIVIYY